MNFLEIVNEVLNELDTPTVSTLSGATGLTKRVMNWVNRTISDIFNRSNDWAFREATGSLTTVAGVDTYSLASTVDVDSFKTLVLRDTKIPLTYLDYEDWDQRNSTSGIPGCYTIFQNQIILSPKPDKAYTLDYRHQVKPVKLVNDTDTPIIPDKWHHVILDGSTYRAKLFLNDEDFRDQQALYEQGIKLMLSHNRDFLGRESGMKMEDGWVDSSNW
ncbi:MAG: hypothetical protein K2X01_11410 [Cyanobacteria bacterium]|nr:hypothetical protein [Cyanobacteriota bacterium]